MIRDTFLNQIIQKLNSKLDPETFERCACSLLREIHPSLVPIPGGSDAGMDGAISDSKGTAFPLVCTIRKDVIGNFTSSLNSYKSRGGNRRLVILATSQELTAPRRRNLEKRAKKLGFTLIHIHAQSAFAQSLYNRPEWCKELLSLEGKAPALSILPKTLRPTLNSNLIGREEDKDWLTRSKGDLLLTGQPGSGKTFLLYTFAKENDGLFVVSDNIDKIIEEIRAKKPEFIIIDDAHLNDKLIPQLVHWRKEVDAEFRIIATCWPSKKDLVGPVLSISNQKENIRYLPLLTRDQVVEVIKDCGIGGPNRLVKGIVDQAGGRPGLAATLCHICMHGGIEDVVLGDALCRDVKATFEPLVGQEATQILAAFSIGGDTGMLMQVVADEFGLSLIDLQNMVAQLAAGGIIRDVYNECLAVYPETLRFVLVRDVFFKGAASLPYKNLIRNVAHLNQVLLTLLGARHRGAIIPDDDIIPLLKKYGSEESWRVYAWLGSKETEWIINNHKEKLLVIVNPGLRLAPELVLPLLFSRSIGDNRPLHSNLDHPLRKIEDWIAQALPGKGETVKRRKMLFESALKWIEQGEDLTTGLKAFSMAFDPGFRTSETDPGSGMKVTIMQGHLNIKEMKEIQNLWPHVLSVIKTKNIENWKPIKELAHHWLYCYFGPKGVPLKVRKLMKSFARKMLIDINVLVKNHQGMLHWIKSQCNEKHFRIKVNLDPDFKTLYPVGRKYDLEKLNKIYSLSIRKLASRWGTRKAETIVRKIVSFENQSKSCGHVWPKLTQNLCLELSKKTKVPEKWVRLFLKYGGEGNWILPFLNNAIKLKRPHWKELILQCLDVKNVKICIIPSLMTNINVPESIFNRITKEIDDLSDYVRIICMRGGIPKHRLKKLLNHKCNKVAAYTAMGMWEENKNIDDSIYSDWSRAIINCYDEDYSLKSIFETHPDIALQWLLKNIKEIIKNFFSEYKEEPVATAIRVLSFEHRKKVIKKLPDNYGFGLGDFINELMGNDARLYKILLIEKKYKHVHLGCFKRFPSESWIGMAKLAINQGYKPEDIANATVCRSRSWEGRESNMWNEWLENYLLLCSNKDENIRKIGHICCDYIQKQKAKALEKEREEDIYGRY